MDSSDWLRCVEGLREELKQSRLDRENLGVQLLSAKKLVLQARAERNQEHANYVEVLESLRARERSLVKLRRMIEPQHCAVIHDDLSTIQNDLNPLGRMLFSRRC